MTNDPGFRVSDWPDRPEPSSLGHGALLTLARKVSAAAADTDPERLEMAARKFVIALDRHLQAEAIPLSRLVPADARILKMGQDRICAIAATLVDEASRGCPVPRLGCHDHAEELIAFLSLQVRDEHYHALGRLETLPGPALGSERRKDGHR